MNRCPITYQPSADKYSEQGLKSLSRSLTTLHDLPLTTEQLRREAAARAAKMSIQGVQPKVSARLNIAAGRFEIADSFLSDNAKERYRDMLNARLARIYS